MYTTYYTSGRDVTSAPHITSVDEYSQSLEAVTRGGGAGQLGGRGSDHGAGHVVFRADTSAMFDNGFLLVVQFLGSLLNNMVKVLQTSVPISR